MHPQLRALRSCQLESRRIAWVSQRWGLQPRAGDAGQGSYEGMRVQGRLLGAPPVAAPVGEHESGAAHAEEAVGYEHGLAVAKVPVLRDVLRRHHQRAAVGVHLHTMP